MSKLGDIRSPAHHRRAALKRRPLKVLLELEHLDKGGREEFVTSLVKRFDLTRVQPVLGATKSGGSAADRLVNMGLVVEDLPAGGRQYSSFLRRHRIDVVHSNLSPPRLDLPARLRVPIVQVVHGCYTWLTSRELEKVGYALQRSDRIVAVSSFVREYVRRRFKVPSNRIQTILNTPDPERLMASPTGSGASREELRAGFGLESDATVFLMVARFEVEKGQLALLRAFNRVAEVCPKAAILCLGNIADQRVFDACVAEIESWGLQHRVKLITEYGTNMADFYRAADVFVLPSVSEGFSLGALEAMMFSLPLILSNVGGSQELIEDGAAVRLVPSWIPDLASATREEITYAARCPAEDVVSALADAISDVSENLTAWRREAVVGPNLVRERYDVSRAARAYEALYMDVASRARLANSELPT